MRNMLNALLDHFSSLENDIIISFMTQSYSNRLPLYTFLLYITIKISIYLVPLPCVMLKGGWHRLKHDKGNCYKSHPLSEYPPVEDSGQDERQQGATAGANQCHEDGEVRNEDHNKAREKDQTCSEHRLRGGGGGGGGGGRT